jgi:hypothetical protein
MLKWFVDHAMGVAFLFSAVTGIFNLIILMRVSGFTDIVLPMALMSDIHDRAGFTLTVLGAVHLFLNHA